jgi:hypothetical protein
MLTFGDLDMTGPRASLYNVAFDTIKRLGVVGAPGQTATIGRWQIVLGEGTSKRILMVIDTAKP